jgi:mRNA interferase RelE/StbE
VYQLEVTKPVQRALEKLSDKDFERIVSAIRGLGENPRPKRSKKLRRNIHRIRVGDWRIIYAVFDKDKLVIVGKVARRSEHTYDKLDELF